MKTQRKIIVYIATSADGYIARPDGDVEWLNRRPPITDDGMTRFYSSIDTILWGRKTYDWLLAYYKKKGTKGEMFDTKVALIVRNDLATWQRLNVVAFLATGIAASAPEMIGAPYVDAADRVYRSESVV